MIEITRVDHIGMAVEDLDGPARIVEEVFGFARIGEREDGTLNARRVRYQVPGEQGVCWELLTPLGDGPTREFLDTPRGPGLHHVGFETSDLDVAAASVDRHGILPLGGDGRLFIEEDRGGEGFGFEILGPQASTREPSAASGHGIGVIAIDHVCHAYRDCAELATWYERTFGMRRAWRTPEGAHDDFQGLLLDIPGRRMWWEIIMPAGDDSFVRRFLDERGPAVHHVAFQVADWERALAACEAAGVPTVEVNEGETGGARWASAVIHPRDTGGLLARIYWEAEPGAWISADKVRIDS